MNAMRHNVAAVALVMAIVAVATISLVTKETKTNWFQITTHELMQVDKPLLAIPEERSQRIISLYTGIHH